MVKGWECHHVIRGNVSTPGLSPLSTPDSILMCYVRSDISAYPEQTPTSACDCPHEALIDKGYIPERPQCLPSPESLSGGEYEKRLGKKYDERTQENEE